MKKLRWSDATNVELECRLVVGWKEIVMIANKELKMELDKEDMKWVEEV